MSKTRRNIIVAAGVATLLAGAGVAASGIASAAGGEDTERAMTSDEATRASKAALDHTGGGRVTDTEAGDEESYYEVEVTTDDGKSVDVQLDESFTVVDATTDEGGADDDEGGADDDKGSGSS